MVDVEVERRRRGDDFIVHLPRCSLVYFPQRSSTTGFDVHSPMADSETLHTLGSDVLQHYGNLERHEEGRGLHTGVVTE